jgi:hypothetical protein
MAGSYPGGRWGERHSSFPLKVINPKLAVSDVTDFS